MVNIFKYCLDAVCERPKFLFSNSIMYIQSERSKRPMNQSGYKDVVTSCSGIELAMPQNGQQCCVFQTTNYLDHFWVCRMVSTFLLDIRYNCVVACFHCLVSPPYPSKTAFVFFAVKTISCNKSIVIHLISDHRV